MSNYTPYVNKIEFPNQEYLDLEERIRVDEDQLEENIDARMLYQAVLNNYDWDHLEYNLVLQRIEDYIRNGFNDNVGVDADLYQMIEHRNINVRQAINSLTVSLSESRNHINDQIDTLYRVERSLNQRLTAARRRFSNMSPEPYRYNVCDVREQFENVDNVVPGSVVLIDQGRNVDVANRYFVAWVRQRTKLLVTSINMNHQVCNVQRVNGRIMIPQAEASIMLNLKTKAVAIDALRSEDAIYRWNGNPTVHPHILGYSEPCLGEYAGPVAEAAAENDFNTVATVLDLFMAHACNTDAAGKQWTTYFKNLVPNPSASRNYFLSSSDLWPNNERGHRFPPMFEYDFEKDDGTYHCINVDTREKAAEIFRRWREIDDSHPVPAFVDDPSENGEDSRSAVDQHIDTSGADAPWITTRTATTVTF